MARLTRLSSLPMRFAFFISILIAFSSCKRDEPTRWDTEWLVPVASGSIKPLNTIDEDLIANDANDVAHIMVNESVPLDALDALAAIPDTSIVNGYTAGIPGGPIDIPVGFEIAADNEGFDLSTGNSDLKRVIFSEGTLTMKLRNDVNGTLGAIVELPSATLNGVPLLYTTSLDPGTAANPTTAEVVYDLAGYDLDLTGVNGDETNRLLGNITVTTLTEASIFGTDSVVAEFVFNDVRIEYALGYFGQYEESFEQEIALENFNFITNGTIQPEEITLDLEVSNPVGIDLILSLNELSATPLDQSSSNVPLTHSVVDGGIQLARAFDNDGVPEFETGFYTIDQGNSNIIDLISSTPNGFFVQGDLQINPLGDISGGNDFYYADYPLEANLYLDLPLCLGFDQFTFQDTLKLDIGALQGLKEGTLFLDIESTLEVAINTQLWLINAEGEQVYLLSDAQIAAAIDPAESQQSWEVPLSEEDMEALEQAEELIFSVQLNTEGDTFAKLSTTDEVSFSARGKFIYEVEID